MITKWLWSTYSLSSTVSSTVYIKAAENIFLTIIGLQSNTEGKVKFKITGMTELKEPICSTA